MLPTRRRLLGLTLATSLTAALTACSTTPPATPVAAAARPQLVVLVLSLIHI